ncbi:MAG TPA: phosphoribosylanthranilate isomerase [Pyrinomonadaceae bacterium]|nr:phosphoribosylanthranilate isomerase [Pyrinomonadaceae bacterium]
MTKVKICGVTNIDDARAVADAGADIIGLNFYRPSARYIAPDAARALVNEIKARDWKLSVVAVFVDEPIESVIDIANTTGIDTVQLHGDESPAFCEELNTRDGLSVIKALRVRERFNSLDALQYPVAAILLDAFHNTLRGGTGLTVDFEVARETRQQVPRLFLSGGLSPENVADAIRQVNPYAVDACSLLESAPGKKDTARVRAFVAAVRNS